MGQLPQHLLDGYSAFKNGEFKSEQERYEKLAEKGQKPKVLMIGCVDSRATPETIFNAGPGEILVVRNVANLVPPAPDCSEQQTDKEPHGTPAALEFGVQALKIEHIVVMGHGRCGGVKAYLTKDREPLSDGDYISKWVNLLGAADKQSLYDSLDRPELDDGGLLERASIIQSLDNLMSFTCIREAVERGALTLHGAWFDIAHGGLEYFDPDQSTFIKVEG